MKLCEKMVGGEGEGRGTLVPLSPIAPTELNFTMREKCPNTEIFLV